MGRYGLYEQPGGRDRATAAFWQYISAMVRLRAENRCEACRGTAGPFEHHHVIKRSQGGPDTVWNVVYLCRACHAATDGTYIQGRLVMEFFCAASGHVPVAVYAATVPELDDASRYDAHSIIEERTLGVTRGVPTGIRISMQRGLDKWHVTHKDLVRVIQRLELHAP